MKITAEWLDVHAATKLRSLSDQEVEALVAVARTALAYRDERECPAPDFTERRIRYEAMCRALDGEQ